PHWWWLRHTRCRPASGAGSSALPRPRVSDGRRHGWSPAPRYSRPAAYCRGSGPRILGISLRILLLRVWSGSARSPDISWDVGNSMNATEWGAMIMETEGICCALGLALSHGTSEHGRGRQGAVSV